MKNTISFTMCCVILSGFLFSIILDSVPPIIPLPHDSFHPSADSSTYWHDDCSSAYGWTENITNLDGLLEYVQTGIDLLTDGSSLYSDTIPAYGANEHGPQFFKKLPYPMTLKNDLELQVDLEHIGTEDCIGSVGIALLDQDNSTIIVVHGYDNYYYSNSTNAYVAFTDSNGDDWEQYAGESGAWNGTVRVWYDSTIESIRADINGHYSTVTPYDIAPEREVHYIGLFFYCGYTGTYESIIVHDILLTSSPPESSIESWFYSCSSTTGFDLNLTWPLDGWLSGADEWTLTDGEMLVHEDDAYHPDDYCYFSEIPNATSGWHGPAFVHKLDSPFYLGQVKSFALQLSVDNSESGYVGRSQFLLMDSNQKPVVRVYIDDSSDSTREGYLFAEYMCSNGTSYRHGMTTMKSFREFNGSMIFRYDKTIGVSVSITGYGEAVLFSPNATEVFREITHIFILTGRLADYTYLPTSIDDISLKWYLGGLEPTITTTGTSGLGMTEYLIISVGVGVVIVLVIIVGVIRGKR